MSTAQSLQLDRLDACIRSVWRRSQFLHLLNGLFAFVGWAVPLFAAAVVVDWLTSMPASGRVISLIVLLGFACYQGWRRGWRHLRRLNERRTALELEACHGKLDSLLVSALQFRDTSLHAGGSTELRQRACDRAEDAVSRLSPKQAVPYGPLRQPALIAATVVSMVVVFAAFNGAFFNAALMRHFCPWLATKYPTNTQIALEQHALVIKEGDSAVISARLGGVVPDQATISVKTGNGTPRAIELEVADDRCVYTIASASRDFAYSIKAGDDRTDWQHVRVVPAPQVKSAHVDLTYPEYLDRPTDSTQALTLTVPEGTRVGWRLTLDRAVSDAQFLRDGDPPVDLEVSEDGLVVRFSDVASASKGYTFSWVEKENGFRFVSPRYHLQVASDQAPRIELTAPSHNLVALLGRPMNMTARVQDDYGIGSLQIAYQVNERNQTIVDLPVPPQVDQGDMPLEWDYREAMPNLEVGDTVSVTLVAGDRYPGPEGPHVARSETRKITFLSKEDYLAHVEEKKNRLLSRVQSLYRQQRSAHASIADFDPSDDGYRQACQLEAIRQELVREQLKDTAARLQELLDDLEANRLSDAVSGESLNVMRQALFEIAEQNVSEAAKLLRMQSDIVVSESPGAADPGEAADAVNASARRLAAMVLTRDSHALQEVFAREARMLAQVQTGLRWRTMKDATARPPETLVDHQKAVGSWTRDLVDGLQNGIRYDDRPMAILRILRRIKDLRDGQIPRQTDEIAALLQHHSDADRAFNLQTDLVERYLASEFSMRATSAYSTVLKTLAQMRLLAEKQARLRDQCGTMSATEFEQDRAEIAQKQNGLRRQVATLILPAIPAPRAHLLDQEPPQPPPARDILMQANRAMAEASLQIDRGDKDAATARQHEAELALARLIITVDHWSAELGVQITGMSTLVESTSNRLSQLEAYAARAISLMEKTGALAAGDQALSVLAESQDLLTEEINAFVKQLDKQYREVSDRGIPPLMNRLEHVRQATARASQALRKNDAEEALVQQERAAQALAEAHAIVSAQSGRLGQLEALLLYQRMVGSSSEAMADLVAEQRDVLLATKESAPDDLTRVQPRVRHLHTCLGEVAPLLDLVAGRFDVGSPLVFARMDYEDAIDAIETGDQLDSVEAQEVSVKSLATVQGLVEEIRTQSLYVTEIVTFLHDVISDGTILQAEQQDLLDMTESASEEGIDAVTAKQEALIAKAEGLARSLEQATALPQFNEPLNHMRAALSLLKSKNAEAAAEQMRLVIAAYAENYESLLLVATAVQGLPSTPMSGKTKPGVVRLVEALVIAAKHKELLRQTHDAPPALMKELAQRQGELASLCKVLAEAESEAYERHPLLQAAARHLADAAAAFASDDRVVLRRSQKEADRALLHFIIEQALLLYQPPGEPPYIPPSDSEIVTDAEIELPGFINDFVSGEVPEDMRSEWNVLGERNRAALNQNFARELPLEYRELLKNYYERVAR